MHPIFKKIISFFAVCVIILSSFSTGIPARAAGEAASRNVYRISGDTRYLTAMAVSEVWKHEKDLEAFENVILATGEEFADALCGGYLSVRKNAPVLLIEKTPSEQLIAYVRDHLKADGTIYVLGGQRAVPDESLSSFRDYTIVRLEGRTRYETNLAILQEAGVSEEDILVCTGENFSDSISVSSTGLPVLLVKNKLTKAQKAFLSEHADNRIFLIGGNLAVSKDVEAEIRGLVSKAERIYGPTRFDTSKAIAETFFPSPDAAILVCSDNFPDGLAAGPLGYALNAPVLLANDRKYSAAKEFVSQHSILSGRAAGGPSVLSDETIRKVFSLGEESVIRGHEYMLRALELAKPNPANNQRILEYAERLYAENQYEDYRSVHFTWSQESYKRGWLYYNGLILDSFLQLDPEKYSPWIRDFCSQYLDGKGGIAGYVTGELDWALPAVLMIDLLHDDLAPEAEAAEYAKAVNFVYNQLEKQLKYPEAGNLYQHSERNGVPTKAWTKWNIALDGIYMSQLFLVRLTELIDSGKVTITSLDGTNVSSGQIWNDVYTRMRFVLEHMRNPETGLLDHVYSVELQTTNGIVWGRGMGWFVMVFLEAAEKAPDEEERAYLTAQFEDVMRSVVRWQDPETFLWYNVMDRGADLQKNQPETSGSAMFAYTLLRGYHNGILKDEVFREAGLRAFNSMAEDRMTEEGLTDTLIGMGPGEKPEQYQNNRFVTNEAKGVGPLFFALKYAY